MRGELIVTNRKELLGEVKKYQRLLKFIIAVLLLWYVFYRIDILTIRSVIVNTNIPLLLGAFFLAIFNQVFISNIKWSIILKAYNTVISFRRLCDMYLMGMFFSMFLPGVYGGDFVRAYQVSKDTENVVEGIMSVVLERVTGLMGLLLILLAALFFVDHPVVSDRFRIWGIGLIIIFFLAFPLLFLKGFIMKVNFLFAVTGKKIEGIINDIHGSISALKDRKSVLSIIFLSLLSQILIVFTNYLIALSVNVKVPFTYLMLVIPVISLLSMIPVTLNGIGVRDVSYIGFLGAVGVEKEAAFSIGFIAFLMGVIMSLYGGIIYMRQK